MSPDEAREEIGRELAGGESVLWCGVPRQGFQLRSSDAFMIPFSLLWGGFALFWESSVIHTRAPFFFKLWGVPFVLMGLYITVGRFFVDILQRSRTAYALTSTRAIIVNGIFSRNVKSLPLKTLTDYTLSERGDGSGTIALEPPVGYRRYPGNYNPWTGTSATASFDMIEDARAVYSKIRTAQEAA